ncbi:HigA family addiction module antitoxin [Candidatus Thiosymbion oneisti]|uniref:HigA family addiction module antitoxin n=1 Tax=Candidatus Thiosymbion oneisti TaxID=589554 RepID=UPI000B29B808|nr:HigA family addiction module antitoxin [Candidatus Thiosymbion oneisti]
MTEQLPPNHPGRHLAEFLDEYELTLYRLAKDIGVQPTRIDQIVKGKRSITADTALRLGRFFGTTPAFWMNLQTNYDLVITGAELGDSLTGKP